MSNFAKDLFLVSNSFTSSSSFHLIDYNNNESKYNIKNKSDANKCFNSVPSFLSRRCCLLPKNKLIFQHSCIFLQPSPLIYNERLREIDEFKRAEEQVSDEEDRQSSNNDSSSSFFSVPILPPPKDFLSKVKFEESSGKVRENMSGKYFKDYGEKQQRKMKEVGKQRKNIELNNLSMILNESMIPYEYALGCSTRNCFQAEIYRRIGKYKKSWIREIVAVQHNLLLFCTYTKPRHINKCIAISSLVNIEKINRKQRLKKACMNANNNESIDEHPLLFSSLFFLNCSFTQLRILYTTNCERSGKSKVCELFLKSKNEDQADKCMHELNQQIKTWKGRDEEMFVNFIAYEEANCKLNKMHLKIRKSGILLLSYRLFRLLEEKIKNYKDLFLLKLNINAEKIKLFNAMSQTKNRENQLQLLRATELLSLFLLKKLKNLFIFFVFNVHKVYLEKCRDKTAFIVTDILVNNEKKVGAHVFKYRADMLTKVLTNIYKRAIRNAYEKIKNVFIILALQKKIFLQACSHINNVKITYNIKSMHNALYMWRKVTHKRKMQIEKIKYVLKKCAERRLCMAFRAIHSYSIFVALKYKMFSINLAAILNKILLLQFSWCYRVLQKMNFEFEKEKAMQIYYNMDTVHDNLINAYEIIPIERGINVISNFIKEQNRNFYCFCFKKIKKNFVDKKKTQNAIKLLFKFFKNFNKKQLNLVFSAFKKNEWRCLNNEKMRVNACIMLFRILCNINQNKIIWSFVKLLQIKSFCFSAKEKTRKDKILMLEYTYNKLIKHALFDTMLHFQKIVKQRDIFKNLSRLRAIEGVLTLVEKIKNRKLLFCFLKLNFNKIVENKNKKNELSSSNSVCALECYLKNEKNLLENFNYNNINDKNAYNNTLCSIRKKNRKIKTDFFIRSISIRSLSLPKGWKYKEIIENFKDEETLVFNKISEQNKFLTKRCKSAPYNRIRKYEIQGARKENLGENDIITQANKRNKNVLVNERTHIFRNGIFSLPLNERSLNMCSIYSNTQEKSEIKLNAAKRNKARCNKIKEKQKMKVAKVNKEVYRVSQIIEKNEGNKRKECRIKVKNQICQKHNQKEENKNDIITSYEANNNFDNNVLLPNICIKNKLYTGNDLSSIPSFFNYSITNNIVEEEINKQEKINSNKHFLNTSFALHEVFSTSKYNIEDGLSFNTNTSSIIFPSAYTFYSHVKKQNNEKQNKGRGKKNTLNVEVLKPSDPFF